MRRKKILVIDDDRVELDITAKTLQKLGQFDVTTTMDSTTALETIRREKPDLLLLDIMMPGVDGLTICKEVKAAPDLKNIKVIMFSAKIFDVDKRNAIRVGADGYVIKALQSDDLIGTINRTLKIS